MKNFVKIKTHKEIKHVTRIGKKAILKGAIVYRVNQILEKPKIGILISKKFGNAVKRNKAKRKILSSLNFINFDNTAEVVFIPKRAILKINFEDLKVEIQKLFI